MKTHSVEILKKLLIMIVFIVTSNCSLAQSYHTSSKKAMKHFQSAYYEFGKDKGKSLEYVNKALQYDENFVDAILLKAELCLELNDDESAIEMYERIFEIDSLSYPKTAISLAKLYAKHYLFDKSADLLYWYLSLTDQKESLREIAVQQLILTDFQKSLFENPVKYNPKNIGDIVNTSADEYVNQFYVNENKLIFTKRYQSEFNDTPFLKENVFVTKMCDSVWSIPELLLENLDDVGAANISADGNEIYFASNSLESGMGGFDIYCIEFKNDRWSLPKNIRLVNTSDWESQPCLSYDKKELYFVRRNKRLGTSDIYVSLRGDDGNWMKPTRLSDDINTEGNEMAPFVHYDGKTLYFSSDTHRGMGGYDLFVARRDDDNEWNNPVNLGYPLNTSDDEINIVVSNNATKAYISVSKTGSYDIYEFDLDEEFRPESVDVEPKSDEEYYVESFNKYDFVVLNNIYFKFDSAELTDDSADGVNSIYNFLILNPDKNILLEGHTDDVGNEDYNLSLSERRAESVKNALINKGVLPERIKTKGNGSSRPLFLDDGRKPLNRRVEMRLL